MIRLSTLQARILLHTELKASGMNQSALAAKLGLSTAYISMAINGKRHISGKLLKWLGLRREVTRVISYVLTQRVP